MPFKDMNIEFDMKEYNIRKFAYRDTDNILSIFDDINVDNIPNVDEMKEILDVYTTLITCETDHTLQLREIIKQCKSIDIRYLNILNKYPDYDSTKEYYEYMNILKLMVLYYAKFNDLYLLIHGVNLNEDRIDSEVFRCLIRHILISDDKISSVKLYIIIDYLNRYDNNRYNRKNISKYLNNGIIGHYENSFVIYVPGIFQSRIAKIVKGIMNDVTYGYIYFQDKFTKYIPHADSINVSYELHDMEHHEGVCVTKERNIDKFNKIKELYNSYSTSSTSPTSSFEMRCVEIIIFMIYHEGLEFNGNDFITDSQIYEELEYFGEREEDTKQLIKYILKSQDTDVELKVYILDRLNGEANMDIFGGIDNLYDEETDEPNNEIMTCQEKHIYLTSIIVTKLKEINSNAVKILSEV